MEKYDFVILGAGSAGCVLANKLSKNPNFNVCLIEAGSKDSDPRIHIPIGFAFLGDGSIERNIPLSKPLAASATFATPDSKSSIGLFSPVNTPTI